MGNVLIDITEETYSVEISDGSSTTTEVIEYNFGISETIDICSNIVVAPSYKYNKQELLLSYKKAVSSNYREFTYLNGNVVAIDIWEDNTKALKLFTKTITYTGDTITQMVIVDEISGSSLTTSIVYNGDDVSSITKTFA